MTDADYENKYIVTEDLKQIINVSTRSFGKPLKYFTERKLIARHLPLMEENGDMGLGNLLKAVSFLLYWDKADRRSIVCCDFGNNRSRTVVEAFHYAKFGFHFEDEYHGYKNHLIYNCECKHLPPLHEVEHELKRIGDKYNQDVQVTLKEMQKHASRTSYNSLAKKTEDFIASIKKLKLWERDYESLASIMECFKQVKVKEGYVLDGFQCGLPHFDSKMVLHARKSDGVEFIPSDAIDFLISRSPWVFYPRINPLAKDVKIGNYYAEFDDGKYIRFNADSEYAKGIVKPLWEDIIVPFNEEGIWEAVLLYIAPMLMPGYWHWAYANITPVTSDSVFIKNCKTIDDYSKNMDLSLLRPTVFMESESKATVFFAAWGWNGLEHWQLDVVKNGDSVEIEETMGPVNMIYYHNFITL